MLKDMKLSTILLLAVVGFLVYCLMKPTEKFTESESSYGTENFAQEESESKAEMESAPTGEVLSEAHAHAELVNQVLAESERKMAVPPTNIANIGGNNYEANDDDMGVGASLDKAFEKPLPENVKTDVVDLNRNNVKNYDAKDYLPKEVNEDWFNTDFSQAKYKMNDDKLINTERYVVGINTVGQSLKNASYDIRGAINVPKYSVSPWNNSTSEPDYNLKPLC